MSVEPNKVSRLSGWWGWKQTPQQYAQFIAERGQDGRFELIGIREDGPGAPPAPSPTSPKVAEADAAPAAQPKSKPSLPKLDDIRPAIRLQCLQAVWGAGEIRPGGKGAHLALADAAGLMADDLVVELGAGLGGFAFSVAQHRESEVIAVEADAEAAQIARAALKGKPFAERVTVVSGDYATADVMPGAASLVVARQAFSGADDMAALAARIAELAADDAIVIVEDFFGENAVPIEDLRPAALDAAKKALTDAGLDLLEERDEGARVINAVVDGLSAAMSRLEGDPATPPEVLVVLRAEGEKWAKASAALSGGGLKFMNLIAAKPPAPPVPPPSPKSFGVRKAFARLARVPKPKFVSRLFGRRSD